MVAGLLGVVVVMAIVIVILVMLNKRKKAKAANEPGITTPLSHHHCNTLSLFLSCAAFEYTNMPPPINVGDNPMYMGADKMASGPPSSQNTLSRQFMNPLYDYDEDEGTHTRARTHTHTHVMQWLYQLVWLYR